jgi:hypothetical protein
MSKLYHQTDAGTAEIILRTQCMKPGSGGLAGGGIYFATTPELTGHKAHRHGVILEATVALGKIHTLAANGDPTMTLQKLKSMGFDSVCIARAVSSGQEYVVYDPGQVTRIICDGAQAEAAAAEAAAAEAAAAEAAAAEAASKAVAENATVFRLERDAAEERASEFLAALSEAARISAALIILADEKAAAEKAAAERATVEKEAAERAAAAAAAEAASLRRRAKAETVAAERVAAERAALARELHSLDEEATALRLPRDAASTQRSDYVRVAGSGMSAARRLLAAAAGRLLAASSSKISSTDRPDIREVDFHMLVSV